MQAKERTVKKHPFDVMRVIALIAIFAGFTCAGLPEIEPKATDDMAVVQKTTSSTDWPGCMESAKLRFIRLDHGGPGWDDGMTTKTGSADANFLREFEKMTEFKAAERGESHSISLLAKYPRDGFPPFVYMTGSGDIGRISTKDIKILREYCLNGGLLFADAGSPRFHRSFVALASRVFPDKKLLDIADDDPMYQIPFAFPNGAPAFWHHGGRRGLGIKHEGRWCVFYHPGDMNDAWKTGGYSHAPPAMCEAAMRLGVNLVFYAFSKQSAATDANPENLDDLLEAATRRMREGLKLQRQARTLKKEGDDALVEKTELLEQRAQAAFLEAANSYKDIYSQFPDHALSGEVRLHAGQCYMRAMAYEEAAMTFQSLEDNAKYTDDIHAQAMYWWAMSKEKMTDDPGALQEACNTYNRMIVDFPDNKWAKYARGRLADPVFKDLRWDKEKNDEPLD